MFFCVIIYELLAECLVLGTVVWKTVPYLRYIRYRGTMVPAMIWPRALVFTSMMLRVLTPAAFGSYGAGIYIPKLGLVPKHVRPVRPVANLYDLLTS